MTEAILLVGGQGSRLRPLTDFTPKPLLPLAGIACTTHQLLKAKAAGVTRVVLATSYLAQIFEEEYGSGHDLGMELVYAFEPEPLGTGGAIANAGQFLTQSGPVLIFNGDVLSDHCLDEQYALHASSGARATLHLTPVVDARTYGCVPIDGQGRVQAFLEKMDHPVSNLINAGCYIFERDVIAAIPRNRVMSVEREIFPELVKEKVMGYVSESYWIDLGTPEAFTRASADLIQGRAFSPALGQMSAEALMTGAEVAPDGQILKGSYLAPGVKVEARVVIEASVILSQTHIGVGAQIRDSFIGRGVVIEGGVKLERVAVGDGARVLANYIVEPGARIPSVNK